MPASVSECDELGECRWHELEGQGRSEVRDGNTAVIERDGLRAIIRPFVGVEGTEQPLESTAIERTNVQFFGELPQGKGALGKCQPGWHQSAAPSGIVRAIRGCVVEVPAGIAV